MGGRYVNWIYRVVCADLSINEINYHNSDADKTLNLQVKFRISFLM